MDPMGVLLMAEFQRSKVSLGIPILRRDAPQWTVVFQQLQWLLVQDTADAIYKMGPPSVINESSSNSTYIGDYNL